jgi:Dolichyl-phosphate-mannose-protein mannosyltransferase
MASRSTATPWWKDPLLVGVGLTFACWSIVSLTWPLSGDDGVFAWMADTVYRGGVPYVDAWDTKGPGAWLPSLLLQLVFGRHAWPIRVFDIAMVVCAVCAIRGIAKRLDQAGDGRVAIALYVLWYSTLDFWLSAQPDAWVASWLILACWFAMAFGSGGALAAGALIGLATLVKPFYIGYLVVAWLIIAFAPQRSRTRRIAQSAYTLLSAAAVIGAVLFAIHVRGGWQSYVELQRWNRDVYAGLDAPWLTRFPAILKGLVLTPWGLVAPIALFGAIRPTREHRSTIGALSVGLLGAVAGVLLQGKGWTYHWWPMLPFLALLGDIGFAALRAETAGEIAGRFRRLALALLLFVPFLAPLQTVYRWLRSRVSTDAHINYERREFRTYYGRYPGSVYQLVDSLAKVEPDSARILVWAMHPAPQVLAGLKIPTKFAVILPLFEGRGTPYLQRYREEFAQEMRLHPPRWWLVPSKSLLAADDELRMRDIELYPEAAASLHADYTRVTESSDWLVYERNK